MPQSKLPPMLGTNFKFTAFDIESLGLNKEALLELMKPREFPAYMVDNNGITVLKIGEGEAPVILEPIKEPPMPNEKNLDEIIKKIKTPMINPIEISKTGQQSRRERRKAERNLKKKKK